MINKWAAIYYVILAIVVALAVGVGREIGEYIVWQMR